MPIRVQKRRECGGRWAVEISLDRLPTVTELEEVAQRWGGCCRQFHQLVWIDFDCGRVTASLRVPRLILRLEDQDLEAELIEVLAQRFTYGHL